MRILLVEDDAHLGEIIVRGLREEGYQIDRAMGGNEAELFDLTRTYGVIVLDRMLPDMWGEELLQKWRQRNLITISSPGLNLKVRNLWKACQNRHSKMGKVAKSKKFCIKECPMNYFRFSGLYPL